MSFFERHAEQLFGHWLEMTLRLDLIGGPNFAYAERLSGDVRNFFKLPNLDHVVAVVALLEHEPEVDRQDVDLLRLIELDQIVMSLVDIFSFFGTLLGY